MDEDEILEYIYEIVDNPMLKCKAKIEYIQEALEEYFEEEYEEPDEEDYHIIPKRAVQMTSGIFEFAKNANRRECNV